MAVGCQLNPFRMTNESCGRLTSEASHAKVNRYQWSAFCEAAPFALHKLFWLASAESQAPRAVGHWTGQKPHLFESQWPRLALWSMHPGKRSVKGSAGSRWHPLHMQG